MRSAGIGVEVGRSTHRRAQDATIPPATVPSPFHIVNENVGQSRKQNWYRQKFLVLPKFHCQSRSQGWSVRMEHRCQEWPLLLHLKQPEREWQEFAKNKFFRKELFLPGLRRRRAWPKGKCEEYSGLAIQMDKPDVCFHLPSLHTTSPTPSTVWPGRHSNLMNDI